MLKAVSTVLLRALTNWGVFKEMKTNCDYFVVEQSRLSTNPALIITTWICFALLVISASYIYEHLRGTELTDFCISKLLSTHEYCISVILDGAVHSKCMCVCVCSELCKNCLPLCQIWNKCNALLLRNRGFFLCVIELNQRVRCCLLCRYN